MIALKIVVFAKTGKSSDWRVLNASGDYVGFNVIQLEENLFLTAVSQSPTKEWVALGFLRSSLSLACFDNE